MTGHTPGEWTACKVIEEQWVIRAVWTDEQGRRCTWYPAMICENEQQDHEANARLIAAAPKLLEALENLTIAIGMGWDLDGVVNQARAAIADATGEQS